MPVFVSDETYKQAVEALEKTGGHRQKAADLLGWNVNTLKYRIGKAIRMGLAENDAAPVAEELPPSDLPFEERLATMKQRNKLRIAHERAKAWQTVRVPIDGPYGICWFGDPHLDDPYCDLEAFERDARICATTEAMYGANGGDSINNWVGKLERLYGEQSATVSEGWELVEWALKDLGVNWLLWLLGNHDCLTVDHEMLTQRGWLSIDDLRHDDQVIGIDADTGLRVWQRIEAVIDKTAPSVLEAKGRGFSLACTDKHRIFGQKRNSITKEFGSFEFNHPAELPARFRVPVSAEGGSPEYDITDDWLRLIGWVMTDGCYQPKCAGVTLYQSKDTTKIIEVLDGCGLPYTHTSRDRQTKSIMGTPLKSQRTAHEFYIGAEYGKKIRALLPEKNIVPTWVDNLSTRQFTVLLNAITDGDGSRYAHSTKARIIYGLKPFLDGLQSSCILHGYRAYLSTDNRGHPRLNVCEQRFFQIERGQTPFVRVDGEQRVWCLKVPHGNFLVRRNGAAHFTGNCWNYGKRIFEGMNTNRVLMRDWDAKLRIVSPCGGDATVWARHNFKGSSIYNELHGLKRAAMMDEEADIYAAFHIHTFATGEVEFPGGRRALMIRARGYKDSDDYALKGQFTEQRDGRSVVTIVTPRNGMRPKCRAFDDVEEGADFLTFRRRKDGFE